jgi:hypothetical protein
MQIYKTLIRPVVTLLLILDHEIGGWKYSTKIWEKNYQKNLRPSETREGMEDKK